MKALRIVGLIVVMTMSLHFANAQYVVPNGNVYYDAYGNAYYPNNNQYYNYPVNNGYVQAYPSYPVYYNTPRVMVNVNANLPIYNQGYNRGYGYNHCGNGYYRGYNNGWHEHRR